MMHYTTCYTVPGCVALKPNAKNARKHTHTHAGEMYRHGQGVDENIDEAINHYRKGGDLGMKEISTMHHDSSS